MPRSTVSPLARHVAWMPLVLAACGGATSNTTNVYATQNNVNVTFAPGAERDAFEPGDPRLVRALERLSSALGHPVELAIDLSTLPRPQTPLLEALLDRSINRLPTDAERYLQRAPDDLAICAPYVQRVELDYDGSRDELTAEIDVTSRTLRVSLRRDAVFASNALSSACEDVVDASLEARFRNRTVASLADDELGPFFRYYSEVRRRQLQRGVARDAPALERLSMRPEVQMTSEMIALERRAENDVVTRSNARRWLVEWADDYSGETARSWTTLAPAKHDIPWYVAGADLGAWLESVRSSLSDDERAKVLDAVLSPFFGNGNRQPQRYHHDVFPGLDTLAFGLSFWDAAPRDADGWPTSLPHAMCPTSIDSRGIRSSGSCSRNWPLYVVEDDALVARLEAELARRNDANLTTTIFAALDDADSDRVLALWRALEPSFRSWAAATEAIVSARGRTQRERRREIYDDLVRQWRERSDRHPTLLFALATLDLGDSPTRSSGLVHFKDWTRIFGARITAREYEAFLAIDPTAPRLAWALFPALAPGPSRVSGVLPLLPAPLGTGEPSMFAGYSISVWDCLGTLIGTLRELGDEAALAHVRRFLEDRAREQPSQDRVLRAYVERTR